jgi:hypothetical protein
MKEFDPSYHEHFLVLNQPLVALGAQGADGHPDMTRWIVSRRRKEYGVSLQFFRGHMVGAYAIHPHETDRSRQNPNRVFVKFGDVLQCKLKHEIFTLPGRYERSGRVDYHPRYEFKRQPPGVDALFSHQLLWMVMIEKRRNWMTTLYVFSMLSAPRLITSFRLEDTLDASRLPLLFLAMHNNCLVVHSRGHLNLYNVYLPS